MKKFLTLKHCLGCVALLFGLLVFVFSFLTNLSSYDAAGNLQGTYNGIIWGAKSMTVGSVTVDIPEATRLGALALPLVGSIVALVAGVAVCVFAFVCPEKKVFFWVAAALLIAAAVFIALVPLFAFNKMAQQQYEAMKPFNPDITLDAVKELMKKAGGSLKSTMSIVSAVLTVLAGAAGCVASFVKK